jgi:hypothetical protein
MRLADRRRSLDDVDILKTLKDKHFVQMGSCFYGNNREML